MAVGGRPEPGDAAAHAEAGDADALALYGGMGPQPVDGGGDVGDDFRVAQVLYSAGAVVQLLLGKAMEQVGSNSGKSGLGQPVGHVANELVNAAAVLADYDGRERPAAPATGHAGVYVHVCIAHLYGFPKRSHLTLQLT